MLEVFVGCWCTCTASNSCLEDCQLSHMTNPCRRLCSQRFRKTYCHRMRIETVWWDSFCEHINTILMTYIMTFLHVHWYLDLFAAYPWIVTSTSTKPNLDLDKVDIIELISQLSPGELLQIGRLTLHSAVHMYNACIYVFTYTCANIYQYVSC